MSVIVSDHVGAKDIIPEAGIVIDGMDMDKLRETIQSLNVCDLKK